MLKQLKLVPFESDPIGLPLVTLVSPSRKPEKWHSFAG